MERILSWLNKPLFSVGAIRGWMVAAAGGALLLLIILILIVVLIKKKKKKKRMEKMSEDKTTNKTEAKTDAQPEDKADDAEVNVTSNEPTTERKPPMPELELANLQGIGDREEQQDAFGISRMDRMEEDGLLAVLCDGMGGMAEGAMIATETASQMVGIFPWADDSYVPDWIYQRSARVFQQFRGHGGATLVAALIRGNQLSFWCVGDSDLFLLREGRLYELNVRQEYKNELILRAVEGGFSIESAFYDAQAGALLDYIGKDEVEPDYTRIPFTLQPEDALLLCSDGVSDTLTLKQIREAMILSPQECCDLLESGIIAAGKPAQDNYTAIALKYHGKNKEES